jgi:hypothetical protein
LRSHLGDPLALHGSIFDRFLTTIFASIFGAILDGFGNHFGINFDDVGSILHRFLEHRFLIPHHL